MATVVWMIPPAEATATVFIEIERPSIMGSART